ncbi:uncharacterized protein V2V93DRAFT_366720 [Kockiozyma suomiensis]|uniref:uncharacterized protein n=1 Tax=Kockiozyma suomiensis TaxID=1337062 RepID=UPI00334349AF
MTSSAHVAVHALGGLVPPRLIGPAITVHGTRLYVHGGKYAASKTDTLSTGLYVLDLESHIWTRLHPPTRASSTTAYAHKSLESTLSLDDGAPESRYFHTMTYHDNRLYIYGGMVLRNATAADLWCYDLALLRWVALPPPPPNLAASHGRWAHCAGVCGHTLVILGGQDADADYLQDLVLYDLSRQVWSTRSRIVSVEERNHVGFGAYRSVLIPSLSSSTLSDTSATNARLFLFSNYNTEENSMTLDVLSSSLVSFSRVSISSFDNYSPPFLRFPVGGMLGDNVLIAGVYLSTAAQYYAVYAYNMRTHFWTEIPYRSTLPSENLSSWTSSFYCSAISKFMILGSYKSSATLLDDYNDRVISFSDILEIDLAGYGVFANAAVAGVSLSEAGQKLGKVVLNDAFADMEIVCFESINEDDSRKLTSTVKRIGVLSRVLRERWGEYFIALEQQDSDDEFIGSMPSTRRGTVTTVASASSESKFLGGRNLGIAVNMGKRALFFPERYEVVRALVEWLYTGVLYDSMEQLQTLAGLLALARNYKICLLRKQIVLRFHEILSETAAKKGGAEENGRRIRQIIFNAAAASGEAGLISRTNI